MRLLNILLQCDGILSNITIRIEPVVSDETGVHQYGGSLGDQSEKIGQAQGSCTRPVRVKTGKCIRQRIQIYENEGGELGNVPIEEE